MHPSAVVAALACRWSLVRCVCAIITGVFAVGGGGPPKSGKDYKTSGRDQGWIRIWIHPCLAARGVLLAGTHTRVVASASSAIRPDAAAVVLLISLIRSIRVATFNPRGGDTASCIFFRSPWATTTIYLRTSGCVCVDDIKDDLKMTSSSLNPYITDRSLLWCAS